MEKLPSKNVEKLLRRIHAAKDGKLPLSSLSDADRDRLRILDDRGLIEYCDPYHPPVDPDSPVIFAGPFCRSVKLSTAGMDYLSDLSNNRRSRLFHFGHDVLMLIIGAAITLIVTFLFNQLAGSGQP